jgi:hypothetical protein
MMQPAKLPPEFMKPPARRLRDLKVVKRPKSTSSG